jgi:alpha-tubulin suppressor-like RCC1 family protein
LKLNSYGQIGDGSSGINRLLPTAVSTSGVLSGKNILQISAGDYQTCVIANDSNSYCWGRNEFIILFYQKKIKYLLKKYLILILLKKLLVLKK